MLVFNTLWIIPILCSSKLLAEKIEDGHNVGGIQTERMKQAVYCIDKVLAEDHRYRLLSVRSKLECAVQCQLDERCVSLVYDHRKRMCYLADSRASKNCSNMETLDQTQDRAISFYQEAPQCGTGERLDPTGQCVCAPGYAGTPCTRYMHDCADVYKYGNWNGNGEYHVKPLASSQPFEVHCRHVTSTRTYIMQRKKRKNRESFDRSWADYKDGFGNLEDDFWLGLEKIHKLTNVERSYKLRITIKFVNNSVLSYIYDDFKVTNETTGYRLQYNKVALNDTGDCFYPLLGAPFSTYDHDRDDNQGENCAKTRKGGFWYRGKGCSTCNPHGIVYGQSNGLLTGAADEAFWSSLGELAPFKINMHIVSYDVE